MNESSLVAWLRRLVYATALVPLVIFSQFISPFHFGKVILFRIIVEVMVALYVLLAWRDRRYLPKSHPITWAFLGFAGVFTLTTITSIAPNQSWMGSLERMGGLFTFWHYFIFYVIAVSVLRTREQWQILVDLIVSAGIVSALYGLLQRFDISFIIGSGGRERIFGTIGNPALFAGYQILGGFLALTMAMTQRKFPAVKIFKGNARQGVKLMGIGSGASIAIAILSSPLTWLAGWWVIPMGVVAYGFYLWVAESRSWAEWYYWFGAGLMLLATAMTVVRGSLLALAVAAVLYTLLWSVFFRSRIAKRGLLTSLAAICVFIFLAVLLRSTPLVQNSPYLRRVTDFSLKTTTVQTRFWAWQAGLKGWSETPKTMLLGWGPENFNIPFAKYFNPKFYTGPGAETFFDRAHNMFVEVLVTMGVVGLLAYLAIFVTLLLTLVKFLRKDGPERSMGIGFIVLTVAYVIHNSFIFDTSANFITFFSILAFVTHLSQRGLDPVSEKNTAPLRFTGLQQTVAIVLAIGLLIFIDVYNLRPAQANFASTRAVVAAWQEDFNGAIRKYKEALAYNTQGQYELRHRFAQYVLEVALTTDTSKSPGFESALQLAVDEVKKNAQDNPYDHLPLLYLSRLYITLGKDNPNSPYNATALEYSSRALTLSPTFIRTYYEVAQAYLNVKQYDKSYEWFKKALDLNPDVGISYWYLAVVEYQRHNLQNAVHYIDLAIEHGYGMSESDTLKAISVFAQVNNTARVAQLYEQLTVQYPTNVQYWASLAVAYAQTGQIQKAADAVRKAMTLNPDPTFQQQAQEFLRQLGQ